jgi:hypothetical protein
LKILIKDKFAYVKYPKIKQPDRAYLKTKALEDYHVLGRRKRASLIIKLVRCCNNTNRSFTPLTVLSEDSNYLLQDLVLQTRNEIANGTFHPELYTCIQ